MVVVEIVLILWLVLGTALHIYTITVANQSKSLEEPGIDEACEKHGIPKIVGWITSYIVTLVIGIPFIVYKMIRCAVEENEKEF